MHAPRDSAPEPVDLGPLPDRVGYLLRRAQVAVFADLFEAFAGQDITPAQYSVLCILHRNPGIRQGRVAEALGIKRTNFVPLVNRLQARGLARRAPVPDDGRAAALFLTEAGERLADWLDRVVAAHEARMEARLGPGGRQQLMALLGRLLPD